MAHTKDTSDDTFELDIAQAGTPVLVDFWAPWCGPCRKVAPVLDEIARDYAGKLTVLKLNTDENPAITGKLGITSIPTMHLYVDGAIVSTIVGVRPKPKLLSEIEPHLS